MSEAIIRLALVWHMHQPYYKDLATGLYRLPWVRLHALKDYYGMVAMLEEFPDVHMTFNLVPSLLLQLEEYAAGTAQEPLQEIAFQPADELNLEERLFVLRFFFQTNVDNLIYRYPRYRELYERAKSQQFRAEQMLPFFQPKDYTDLQVLSQLAWSDEMLLSRDPEMAALVEKQQGYSFADQELLRKKQLEFVKGVIPAYGAAAARGQIEISTSPFYHPILPLLCDNHIATEAHPFVPLPRRHFRHPEDAHMQLARALELHQRLFARTPQGVWPSEGSVSEEVLRLCASLGFRWIATDQRILSNSTGIPFSRNPAGTIMNAEQLYAPYRFDTPSGPIQVLFRDRELSDLIGFVYSRMDPEAAAGDLVRRIHQSAQPVLQQGRNVLLPIILDGENAWEYFSHNGRSFLRALYRRLAEEPQMECVTVSEALARHGEARLLPRLAPGSWINANFDIWIGSEEDNQAWDLLTETRDFFTEHQQDGSAAQRILAQEELLVAEGSDWCWWYGPEHSTANDPDFDALYRTHLANVYRALGHRPPDIFSQPIARLRLDVISSPPVAALSPRVDGRITSYFEWMGAGNYRPITRATTMQGQPPILRELFYARNSDKFFLRIDFCKQPSEALEKLSLRLRLRNAERCSEVLIAFSRGSKDGPIQCHVGSDQEKSAASPISQVALGKILELELNLAALGFPADRSFEFQVSVWQERLPLESLPLEGWLTVPVPD
ncbi:MAG: glycoside hydrolase [Acidobacteria bacterium]|nr:glycoside hydrolase [Acidobacteriota bacterium]